MSLFDGMAGILTGLFGAPVAYLPRGGAARTIDARCRPTPIELTDDEGHTIIIVAPTLRVQRNLAPELARSDQVVPTAPPSMAGKTYSVVNVLETGSPAADGFLVAELEEILS